MIMMTIILAHTAGVGGHVERIGHAFMILAAIVLASHVVRTADRTHKAYLQGVGYDSRSWVDSPTMRAVAALPADADRKSVVAGKGGSVRVGLGGRGLIKKTKTKINKEVNKH